MMKSSYDPFNRESDLELEQRAAAQEEHQLWSLNQARLGQSAAQRESSATWVRRVPLPDEARS